MRLDLRSFRWRRFCLVLVSGLCLFGGWMAVRFIRARSSVEEEWTRKMPQEPRSPDVVRGLLNSMMAHPEDHLSFLPQSAWDNDVCAGNVINAVNFLLGERRLVDTAAWLFEKANAGTIDRLYAREQDFAVVGERIVETHDRGFWLSGILDMVGQKDRRTAGRMYIVGYHYTETRSDTKILSERENGGTLNSHLLLLLGRQQGRWWGYHFYHDPKNQEQNPFEIIDMGECVKCDTCTDTERCMPAWFDLIYIWEVRDTRLPVTAAPVRLIQNSAPYTSVVDVIGLHGNGRLDHFMDTIAVSHAALGDHFSTVVSLGESVVEMPVSHRGGWHGEILGLYRGLPIRRQVGPSRRGVYGLEYQCVELVNRYYHEQRGHRNLTRTGDADTYWYNAVDKGLVRFPNGGMEPPRLDDILLFDPPGSDTVPGHIGIVSRVSDRQVCIVQQNAPRVEECFVLQQSTAGSTVIGTVDEMPCVGWSRLGGSR